MAEHIESSNAVKSALQTLGAQYKYDGVVYTLLGFHPGVLVMKDSDGNWYDAVQYAEHNTVTEGEDKKMVFIRRASDFADKFEVVV